MMSTSNDNERANLAFADRKAGKAIASMIRGPREIWTACQKNDALTVRRVLQDGTSPDVRNSAGVTPLHICATQGHERLAIYLVNECSANIHLCDFESGWTALHRALYHDNLAIAVFLLQKGARLNDRRGQIGTRTRSGSFSLAGNYPQMSPMMEGMNDPGSDIRERCGSFDSTLSPYLRPTTSPMLLGSSPGSAQSPLMYGSSPGVSGLSSSPLISSSWSLGPPALRQNDNTPLRTSHHKLDEAFAGYVDNDGNTPLDLVSIKLQTNFQEAVRQVKIASKETEDDTGNCNVGGGQVWSFGKGDFFKLGYANDSKTGVQGRPKLIEALQDDNVVTMAAGKYHSMAVTSSGALYTWGGGRGGRLGLGTVETQSQPRRVTLPDLPKSYYKFHNLVSEKVKVLRVSAAANHSIAIISGGAVLTWGQDKYLQLGHGGFITKGSDKKIEGDSSSKNKSRPAFRTVPRRVEGPLKRMHVVSVAAGKRHSVVVTSEGRVFSWGSNQSGQLGYRETASLAQNKKSKSESNSKSGFGSYHCNGVPHEVSGFLHRARYSRENTSGSELQRVVQVSASNFGSAVRTECNRVWQWGCGVRTPIRAHFYISEREKGTSLFRDTPDNENGNREAWTKIAQNKVKITEVQCAKFHSIAVSTNGDVFTWSNGVDLEVLKALDKGSASSSVHSSLFSDASGSLNSPPDQPSFVMSRSMSQLSSSPPSAGFSGYPAPVHPLAHSSSSPPIKGALYSRGIFKGYTTPTRVEELRNVNIINVCAGPTHSCAVSDTGDLYTWGSGPGVGIVSSGDKRKSRKQGMKKGTPQRSPILSASTQVHMSMWTSTAQIFCNPCLKRVAQVIAGDDYTMVLVVPTRPELPSLYSLQKENEEYYFDDNLFMPETRFETSDNTATLDTEGSVADNEMQSHMNILRAHGVDMDEAQDAGNLERGETDTHPMDDLDIEENSDEEEEAVVDQGQLSHEVPSLLSFCQRAVARQVDIPSVIDSIAYSQALGMQPLLEYCADFFRANLDGVLVNARSRELQILSDALVEGVPGFASEAAVSNSVQSPAVDTAPDMPRSPFSHLGSPKDRAASPALTYKQLADIMVNSPKRVRNIMRRARAVRKKLSQIRKLEHELQIDPNANASEPSSTAQLSPDRQSKLGRKPRLLSELEELEGILELCPDVVEAEENRRIERRRLSKQLDFVDEASKNSRDTEGQAKSGVVLEPNIAERVPKTASKDLYSEQHDQPKKAKKLSGRKKKKDKYQLFPLSSNTLQAAEGLSRAKKQIPMTQVASAPMSIPNRPASWGGSKSFNKSTHSPPSKSMLEIQIEEQRRQGNIADSRHKSPGVFKGEKTRSPWTTPKQQPNYKPSPSPVNAESPIRQPQFQKVAVPSMTGRGRGRSSQKQRRAAAKAKANANALGTSPGKPFAWGNTAAAPAATAASAGTPPRPWGSLNSSNSARASFSPQVPAGKRSMSALAAAFTPRGGASGICASLGTSLLDIQRQQSEHATRGGGSLTKGTHADGNVQKAWGYVDQGPCGVMSIQSILETETAAAKQLEADEEAKRLDAEMKRRFAEAERLAKQRSNTRKRGSSKKRNKSKKNNQPQTQQKHKHKHKQPQQNTNRPGGNSKGKNSKRKNSTKGAVTATK